MKGERLLDAVARLLADRKRCLTYEIIAAETGVSIAKLSRLHRGKADGMPVDTVQTVYEYLADKPLIGE